MTPEVDAVDVLHREKPVSALLEELVELDQIGMREVRERAELALDAENAFRINPVEPLQAADLQASAQFLAERPCELLIVGSALASEAQRVVEELGDRYPDIPCVFEVDAQAQLLAVEALRAGAADVLLAPVDDEQLERVLEQCLDRLGATPRSGGAGARQLIGSCAAMREVQALARRAAKVEAALLLCGEAGSGRRTLARSIHATSARAQGPFVELPCFSAEREGWTVLTREAQRGGHRPGAVTAALGGTLFVTGLERASHTCQQQLLQLINDACGGSDRRDVRVIVSSEKALGELKAHDQFLAGLAYRLGVLPIRVPPLRERREDIPELVREFARRAARRNGVDEPCFEEDALRLLTAQPWEGNVTQLESFVERLAIFGDGPTLGLAYVEQELSRFVGFVAPPGGGTRPLTSSAVPLAAHDDRPAEVHHLLADGAVGFGGEHHSGLQLGIQPHGGNEQQVAVLLGFRQLGHLVADADEPEGADRVEKRVDLPAVDLPHRLCHCADGVAQAGRDRRRRLTATSHWATRASRRILPAMYDDVLDEAEAVYVCRFRAGRGSNVDSDYGAHIAGLSSAVQRTESHPDRLLVVIIQDPGYPAPNAGWRKKIAQMTGADNFKPIVAFVTANPVIRGVLTAIAWISKPKYEQKIHARLSEALDWLEGKRGRSVSRLRELAREIGAPG